MHRPDHRGQLARGRELFDTNDATISAAISIGFNFATAPPKDMSFMRKCLRARARRVDGREISNQLLHLIYATRH